MHRKGETSFPTHSDFGGIKTMSSKIKKQNMSKSLDYVRT